eukprot:2385393-Amphidinium_carterae.3
MPASDCLAAPMSCGKKVSSANKCRKLSKNASQVMAMCAGATRAVQEDASGSEQEQHRKHTWDMKSIANGRATAILIHAIGVVGR